MTRMSPRARGRARTLAVVAVLLSAAACMQVPDSGPVVAGPEVRSQDEPVLQYVPDGPRPGADPNAVINGYLDAMRAYPANPAVVREFLTERAAARWVPGAGTQIYTDRPEIEQVGVDRVSIETPLRARLTSRGAWQLPEPGEGTLSRVFHLTREGGEWRITDPAPGLLLPEYDFERYYRPYSLYFFDPALRVLVADPVYLPQGDQTTTLLLRGLLRGPTQSLRGAVRTMLPTTDRTNASVPVGAGGVAEVQLPSQVRGLGASERELLAAQLSWTLRQVPDVESIRVNAGGSGLALAEGSNAVDVEAGADFDPADQAASQALFALRGDEVVTVDPFDGATSRVPGALGSGRRPVGAFAVDRSAQQLAVVTGDGRAVDVGAVGSQGRNRWLDGAESLQALQWDIHGLLWALDRTGSGSAFDVLSEARAASVRLGDDTPDDVRSFALSRDGVRLAVVDGSGASSRLLLGRVRRPQDDSLNIAVDHWREIRPPGGPLRDIVDVAWASPTELTVVAQQSRGTPQVVTVSIDGSIVEPSALLDLDLVSVADAPEVDRPPVVTTRPGSLFVQLSDRWSEVAVDAPLRAPSYVE